MGQVAQAVFAEPERQIMKHEDRRPVDLVHLARQTGGDRSLEEEVLQLFLRQANLLKRDLQSQLDGKAIKRVAHTLNGTARAVGAFDVADLAKSLEDDPAKTAIIAQLSDRVDDACDYISSILR